MHLSEEHLRELSSAYDRLEQLPLAIRLANAVGRPLEALSVGLPKGITGRVMDVAGRSLSLGMCVALSTVRQGPTGSAQLRRHRIVVGSTGAVGGFFGAAGLPLELPFTTVVMLRAIAGVAREEGEDMADPRVALECLGVLAHGGPSPHDDATETSYYAVRAALAPGIRQAAEYVSRHVAGDLPRHAASLLLRVLQPLVARFGQAAVQKAIAQSVPGVGAAAGAAVNVAFIGHFQSVAQGHFAVRRLERLYGREAVREAYGELREARTGAAPG